LNGKEFEWDLTKGRNPIDETALKAQIACSQSFAHLKSIFADLKFKFEAE
jgi:hypothetical protein